MKAVEISGRRTSLLVGLLTVLLTLLLAAGLASPAKAATDRIVFTYNDVLHSEP